MPDKPKDLGFICERLLYYSTVNLHISSSYIDKIVSSFGYLNLIYLLEQGFVTFSFEDSMHLHVSIKKDGETEEDSKYRCIIPDSKTIYGEETNPLSWEDYVLSILKSVAPEKEAKIILELILQKKVILDIDKSLKPQIWNDVLDQQLLNQVVEQIFLEKKGTIPSGYNIHAIKESDDVVRFKSSTAFEKILTKEKFAASDIIQRILHYNRDIYLATYYDSDVSSDDLLKKILSQKILEILEKQESSNSNILDFEKIVFPTPFTLRDKINNNKFNIDDFISVLRKAQELGFKNWLSQVSDSATLIHEYNDNLSQKTSMQQIYDPLYGVSLLLFAGIGIISGEQLNPIAAPVVGLGLSIVDKAIASKINKGWKPGIFVNKYYKAI